MHRKIKALTLTLAMIVTLAATAVNTASASVYADISGENGKTIPTAVVNIPVVHTITGDRYAGDDTFEFLLTAQDDKCPMPEGSSGRVKSVRVKGSENPDFGDISFEYPDEYRYTVSRQEGKYENLDIGNEEYSVLIIKFNDGTTQMVLQDGRGEKVETITYTDQYKAPSEPAVKHKSPKTGDEELRRSIMLYAGISLTAAAGLILILAVTVVRRLRSGSEKGGLL